MKIFLLLIAALAADPGSAPVGGEPEASPATPARLIGGTIAGLFRDSDYPRKARRASESGDVKFRVLIDPNGNITECHIVKSSGSAILDAATCRIVRMRARIIPARDAAGRPASDSAVGLVHWRLPKR